MASHSVLVHILYLHKKPRLLNILCTGYKYFKDSSVLYLDLLRFNMTVAWVGTNSGMEHWTELFSFSDKFLYVFLSTWLL